MKQSRALSFICWDIYSSARTHSKFHRKIQSGHKLWLQSLFHNICVQVQKDGEQGICPTAWLSQTKTYAADDGQQRTVECSSIKSFIIPFPPSKPIMFYQLIKIEDEMKLFNRLPTNCGSHEKKKKISLLPPWCIMTVHY